MTSYPLDCTRWHALHRSPAVRAQAIRTLERLMESYPNMRICQLIANALPGDIFNTEDDELVRALQKLEATYGQFKAARIKP